MSDKTEQQAYPAGCTIAGLRQKRGETYANLYGPDGLLLATDTLAYIAKHLAASHIEAPVSVGPVPVSPTRMVIECLDLLQRPCLTIEDTVEWSRASERLQQRIRAFLVLEGAQASKQAVKQLRKRANAQHEEKLAA